MAVVPYLNIEHVKILVCLTILKTQIPLAYLVTVLYESEGFPTGVVT